MRLQKRDFDFYACIAQKHDYWKNKKLHLLLTFLSQIYSLQDLVHTTLRARKVLLEKMPQYLETILLPLLLLVLAQISLAEKIKWSMCSSGDTWKQWNYENPGIQVKKWLKSVIDKNEKSPFSTTTEMTHLGARFNFF